MNLGPTELIIVLVIVFLLFGATRLPKLARSLGEASQEFKKGVNERGKDSNTPAPAADATEEVTMTRAELDALLAESAGQVRPDGATSTP